MSFCASAQAGSERVTIIAGGVKLSPEASKPANKQVFSPIKAPSRSVTLAKFRDVPELLGGPNAVQAPIRRRIVVISDVALVENGVRLLHKRPQPLGQRIKKQR